MHLDELGLVGNCQISALVDRWGSIVWSCLPRFDSPPVFGALLDEKTGGRFIITSADDVPGVQRYLPNTNILETRFDGRTGSFRILDFAPRFYLFERIFRPTKLIRIVEPLSGAPRIRVHCDPVLGWSRERPMKELGSHHVSYHGYGTELRLTMDTPMAYTQGESFALTNRKHFVLAWGSPVEEPLAPLCERFLQATIRYWQSWVKHCAIPPAYQDEVIRSALVLKLHCYEDTGAIVAAMTTSIPESPGSGRTWDYRYCWLRDAYYTLEALRLLGHFEEREGFLEFLVNVAGSANDLDLAPLYRIDGKTDLDEYVVSWAGYRGEKPVRVGNAAATHKQNDVFGEMVLALTPMFLDARFREQVTGNLLSLVSGLARKAVLVSGQPDAGIWEYRSEWRPQTFSTLMCWAAAERMARIAQKYRPHEENEFASAAARIRDEILTRASNGQRNSLVADYGGTEVDAALLEAITLRLLPPSDPRMVGTLDAIRNDLSLGGWLRRYRVDDGFGKPSVAFLLCTFWLIEATSVLGRIDDARALMQNIRTIRSPLGLLAEDVAPETGEMWGNFPQAYSHVGLIHAAFAASPSWSEVG